MRDIKRIKRILKGIEKLWLKNPDQRFFQMLINYGFIDDTENWFIEDDEVEKHIEEVSK